MKLDYTLINPVPIHLAGLMAIMPLARERARLFLPHLNAAMREFDIIAPPRVAAFLAQVAHESGQLQYTRELWGPTPAQQGYEGRADLGNTQPGDGKRYMGRGFIQITGRANYAACSVGLYADVETLLAKPEMLEEPGAACLSAAWFWADRGLNLLADVGNFRAITRRINGGYNGWQDRNAYYTRAKAVLGVTDIVRAKRLP